MRMEFSSQRRRTLLFLTINMAAVTSLANQQYSVLIFSGRHETCNWFYQVLHQRFLLDESSSFLLNIFGKRFSAAFPKH